MIVKTALLPLILFAAMQLAWAQETKVISTDEFMRELSLKDGNVKVINFWATWCKPCVDELPHFVKAADELKSRNIEFIYVSVDFQSQHNKVDEKVKQLGLKGILYHLNASGTDWIDAIDKDWSGAIPYTLLLLPNGKRITHYDEFETYQDLKSFINSANNN